jgi:DNA-binding beta-propeller fold protein YncE
VYVADAENARIQYFTPSGSFLGEWGRKGSGEGEFNLPDNVAVAPNGDVYVSNDKGLFRVQRFSPRGEFVGGWGAEGTGAGEFGHPGGIAVGADGVVYVVDTGNDRVQYFTPAGSFLGSFGSKGSAYGEFNVTWDMDVGPDGTVYVVDQGNNRIHYFREITGEEKLPEAASNWNSLKPYLVILSVLIFITLVLLVVAFFLYGNVRRSR